MESEPIHPSSRESITIDSDGTTSLYVGLFSSDSKWLPYGGSTLPRRTTVGKALEDARELAADHVRDLFGYMKPQHVSHLHVVKLADIYETSTLKGGSVTKDYFIIDRGTRENMPRERIYGAIFARSGGEFKSAKGFNEFFNLVNSRGCEGDELTEIIGEVVAEEIPDGLENYREQRMRTAKRVVESGLIDRIVGRL